MTIDQEPQVVETNTLLFVAYGTLRKGEALHDWIADSIIRDHGPVVVKGAKLHYPVSHRNYPLLVWSGFISDKAVGELYELDFNEQTIAMLQMEMNAGYKLLEASVETPEGDLAEATLCAWPHAYGNEVPNNDWCSVERREWWR
jgi:gamma-glutamylcyclotransferase (GGCT)/AIG2-like uncharacterized protein YtfP